MEEHWRSPEDLNLRRSLEEWHESWLNPRQGSGALGGDLDQGRMGVGPQTPLGQEVVRPLSSLDQKVMPGMMSAGPMEAGAWTDPWGNSGGCQLWRAEEVEVELTRSCQPNPQGQEWR
ncbi:hypothetical protein CRENBAI_005609 [Crenichthys baileyi]|uniref:Uncharacterized protein n=1 Tax=Crenichthys baileyi TaxID=28760 RepID=A0AAV9S1J6_9TELE